MCQLSLKHWGWQGAEEEETDAGGGDGMGRRRVAADIYCITYRNFTNLDSLLEVTVRGNLFLTSESLHFKVFYHSIVSERIFPVPKQAAVSICFSVHLKT